MKSGKLKSLSEFLLHFWNLHEISNILKTKSKRHRSDISEVIDFERRTYLSP